MKEIISQLIAQTSLSFDDAYQFFSGVMQGNVSEIELTAALIALKIKGETANEIAGAAKAMREHATVFNNPCSLSVDSCGTGGDGANTINVSTTAALVSASMGINMVKHGNRSVSSNSGSSDLLTALGIKVDMSVEQAQTCLAQTNFTFLFAPLYHAGVKHAAPVRGALKTRTLFNILGPLANPAKPEVQLLGVYDKSLCRPMAETLQKLGCRKAMVVHGAGTDEIALHGTTYVVEVNQDNITEYELTPEDFGLANYPLSEIAGEGPEQNAQAAIAILKGQGKPAHNAAIIANVAAVLYLTGHSDNLKDAATAVVKHLESGKAYQHLANIVEVSNG